MNQEPLTAGWHGSLNLVYVNRTGVTQLARDRSCAPLKIQRPFYPEGAAVCHSVVLHTAGGIVGGDRLSFDIHLQPDARALITTAAAGKIYRSNGKEARQTVNIQLDAGACLEWLPQEAIIFNGAIYQQDLVVELSPGATILLWEIVRFGRSARGEQFLQGNWRSRTEIWQQGRPLWIDRQWLPGGEEMVKSPHGLAGKPVVGSFAFLGQPVTPELVQNARSLFSPAPSASPSQAGATRLLEGLSCRYRGESIAEVRQWFIAVWHLLRQSFSGRPSCPPRVWPL